MAGTRLAIHTIFFFQIVVLIGVALYQIRDVLVVDRFAAWKSPLTTSVALKSFRKSLIFPLTIRLFVPHALLETFPNLDGGGLQTLVESSFQNKFNDRLDTGPRLHLRRSTVTILSDEGLVRSLCLSDHEEEQKFDIWNSLKRLHEGQSTTEQEYLVILCLQYSQIPVDIVHRDGELDIIRIHGNTDAWNDTKTEASRTAFIDSAVKSLMDLIFFPSNIRLPEGKLPPWFHLHFILMDQDLRELHVSPKQLQTKLVTVFSNSVQEKIQPLIHQLSAVAGLTPVSMDVTMESFVPIDDIRTFLTEERFSHRRNSRLLPFLATLHGVPEPHYLQYILYIASGENQLASITTTCNNDTGEVSRASSMTTVNIPGSGAIMIWSVDNNKISLSEDDEILSTGLYEKIVPAVDFFLDSILKDVELTGTNDLIQNSHQNMKTRPFMYQHEQYALLRCWILQTFDNVVDEILVFVQWLERSPRIPVPAKVAEQIDQIQKIITATQHTFFETGHLSRAMKELQIATTLLQMLKSDGAMVESRLILPTDQMLAVFSPLVLPLLAPLFFGLLREVKRYRKLSISKRVSATVE